MKYPGPIMAVMRLSSLLAPLIATGCTPYNRYSPAIAATFEPTTAEIEVLAEPPKEPYQIIGYAESRGEHMGQALPILKKLAQEHGGHALLKIEETEIYLAVHNYRAAVIRYAAQTQAPAR